MNCKIIKVCNISICCEVILKMQTANSEKTSFYNCVKNVEIKMTDIIFIFSIFITKKIENKLIFKHLWKQVIEANIFSKTNESVK